MHEIDSMNYTGRASARPVIKSRNERGIAMVIALMVLTSLSVLTLLFIASASVDRRMGGDSVTKSKALHYAEAGVAEGLARIQSGSGPDPTVVNAPRKVVQILNASTGGVAGADTVLLATGQPAGGWLPYSTAASSNKALTIEFVTDAARTMIYKYDKTQNPPIQTSTGLPIYRITSVGKVGTVSKRLVVDAIKPSGTPPILAAEMANTTLEASGGSGVCGLNHSPLMPAGAVHTLWHTGTGDVTGGWSTGTTTTSGGGVFTGVPLPNLHRPVSRPLHGICWV